MKGTLCEKRSLQNSKQSVSPLGVTNGSLVVKVSPLVAVSESTNGCHFVLGENRKIDIYLSKVKLR